MESEVERFTVADVYNPPATTTWKPPTFIKQSFEKPTNPFNFETIREDSRIRLDIFLFLKKMAGNI